MRKLHRGLMFSLLGFTVLVGAALGYGTYEYQALRPEAHFANLKPITVNDKSNIADNEQTSVNLPGQFNVVLIGSDARPGEKASHSDTIVLVHVDLNNHTYNMLSIPRDARTYDPSYGYTKLTTIQFMDENKYGVKTGIEQTVATISRITGVPVQFYAETNFYGLKDMVNAVGGISMNLPYNITITHPLADDKQMKGQVFKKGEHFLNGSQTIEVVRERDTVPGGDYGRQQIQERALIGIAEEVMKPRNLPRLPKLARTLPKFLIATNLQTDDLISLGLAVKSNFQPSTQIHYFQVPSVSTYAYDDVLQASNDELLLDTKKLKAVINGYFLGQPDIPPTTPSSDEISTSDNPGSELLTAPPNPQDFGPLGEPGQ